jgi:hypothetical protein
MESGLLAKTEGWQSPKADLEQSRNISNRGEGESWRNWENGLRIQPPIIIRGKPPIIIRGRLLLKGGKGGVIRKVIFRDCHAPEPDLHTGQAPIVIRGRFHRDVRNDGGNGVKSLLISPLRRGEPV